MTTVTVDLPDELAQQARQAGLLRSETLAILLQEAIRKSRVNRLFSTIDKLADLTPPMSDEEIQAEIDAARADRRARNADRR